MDDFVLEFDSGSFDFSDTAADDDVVVVFYLSFIANPGFDNRKEVAVFFEAFVGKPAGAADVSAGDLEPVEVVGVIGVPHLVGFAISNADGGLEPLHRW